MYAQLGNIRFEKLKGFATFGRDREATFAEMPLLDGKARLQRIGDALTAIKIGIVLRRQFTDPVADLAELNDLRAAGEVLPLLTGDGGFIGNFVITKISETLNEADTLGVPISLGLDIELREFIDPNPEATAAADAQKDGFATNPAKVVPVRLERIGTTPMAIASQNVTTANNSAVDAVKATGQAAANADDRQSILNRAAQTLKQAQNAAQNVIDQIQNFASLATVAPDLLDSMQNLYANVSTMAGYVQAGDLTNALTQGDALSAAVGTSTAAVQPLNQHLIKRLPQ